MQRSMTRSYSLHIIAQDDVYQHNQSGTDTQPGIHSSHHLLLLLRGTVLRPCRLHAQLLARRELRHIGTLSAVSSAVVVNFIAHHACLVPRQASGSAVLSPLPCAQQAARAHETAGHVLVSRLTSVMQASGL